MLGLVWFLAALFLLCLLLYYRASWSVFGISFGLFICLLGRYFPLSFFQFFLFALVFLAFWGSVQIAPVRCFLYSSRLLTYYQRVKPHLSATEREALSVGTLGFEGDLIAGLPNWTSLHSATRPTLTPDEQAFLDHSVPALCAMVDHWEIQQSPKLPESIWNFMVKEGFFGLVIPTSYGGKGFSATAHSAIIARIASCSNSLATIVAVPNSLGPAELLLEYGTEEQKNYYLPRLAKGLEVPCFALTSPEAGSDASAMPDTGIVCRGQFEGKERIGVLLNWDKRYITLAPIATLLGLAFKLRDPEMLLGQQVELGITCALIPTNMPGVEIGRYHRPLYASFPNGPTKGKDVFIPLDWIIGGAVMAGQGWRMLVERLSVGRGISLPSVSTGNAQAAAWSCLAYCRVRRQFHHPICDFEGVSEILGQMIGKAYMIDALRSFAIQSIDRGEPSALLASVTKCYTTEYARQIAIHAMDVLGGKGICLGPRNFAAQAYVEAPIAITVEGSNVLTRSMMIVGQGLMRGHPYLLKEWLASERQDRDQAVCDFDRALFAHVALLMNNKIRAFWLGLVNGRGIEKTYPKNIRPYYQQLSRFSAAFAYLVDVCILTLGASLKRRETISGRLADALAFLCWGSALLRYFADRGSRDDELPMLHWSCQTVLYHLQTALYDLISHFPYPLVVRPLLFAVFPRGRTLRKPKDALCAQMLELALSSVEARERLWAEAVPASRVSHAPLAQLEEALVLAIQAERLGQGATSPEEHQVLLDAERARLRVIAVDDFPN